MMSQNPAAQFDCHPASHDHRDQLIAIYTDAFYDDPVFSWLFPDDGTRTPQLEKFFTTMVDHTFGHGGSALQTRDYGAVSMYFPPEAVEQPEDVQATLLRSLRDVLGPDARRAVHLLTLLGDTHPKDLPPHYYGTFVAARPEHQGAGLGTRLKQGVFALADQRAAGAYAEASSPRNLALYERLGQCRLGIDVTLPRGPQIFPIWRPPRPAPRTVTGTPGTPSTPGTAEGA
ncbi:GNAT family N-acetyltransferase [Streptomyces sp. NPDC087420]|uniref:GNAT family N-acetyltransferase n=1 Tax=Streptomyces sp. NPDC087420 TaxID=3365785 RepID=UPI003837BDD1